MNTIRLASSLHVKALKVPSISRFMSSSSLFASSSKELIITAVGNDRCGIVSDMTKYVTDVGGNVGESTASKLGSHFSLMMLVHVPEPKVEQLKEHLQKDLGQDLQATVHVLPSKQQQQQQQQQQQGVAQGSTTDNIGYTGRFTLEGADHPGIVHKVTSVLAKNGLSIDKMETSDEIAPHGGTTLFRMMGVAHAYTPVAAGFDPEKVKQELMTLGNDLNCDIEMMDIPKDEWRRTYYAA